MPDSSGVAARAWMAARAKVSVVGHVNRAADLVKAGYAQHLLTVPAADNTLRLLPPLNITDDEIAEAVSRLDRAAASLA